MYGRLAEQFNVPDGQNIWRGKGLIIVFQKEKDYFDFERDSHHTDAKGTAGMCHSYGSGLVHVAFFRQPDELAFAHILVHESTHGFIHRYRSPVFIPSWANEGLAETIASELVPQPTRATNVHFSAMEGVRSHKGVGDEFFKTEHIEGWQYPVAESLCTYMITQNKTGYVNFINALKDGMPINDALTKVYGAAEDRLVEYFTQWLEAPPRKK